MVYQYDEESDLPWVRMQLSKLIFGDDSPEVRAYVQLEGEDKLGATFLGRKTWERVQKVAAFFQLPIRFWKENSYQEEMTDRQKGWRESLAHGLHEGSFGEIYDGDEDNDPRQPKEGQLARSFTLPYYREPVSYSEVGWNENGSYCIKEHTKGEVVENGGYKVFAIYLAKALPSNGKHWLVGPMLGELAANKDWSRFNKLRDAFRTYRKAMSDRSSLIKDTRNGYKDVYFMSFEGFVLFSPITWNELSDRRKEDIQSTHLRWKLWNETKDRLQAAATELQSIKEALNGLLAGDQLAEDVYWSELRKLCQDIRIHAPWMWKTALKPFYKDIYGVLQQGGNKDVSLFDDEGNLTKSNVTHVEISKADLEQYGLS